MTDQELPSAAPSPDDLARLPTRRKVGWGSGGLCLGLMAGGFPTLLNPIYNIALRLDATALGLIATAPRFLDAAYDVWLGHVSDNAATRWGRRRPFIAAGAVLVAVAFAAVWWVPVGWSSRAQLGFFAVTSMAYWVSFSTFSIPYSALGYELSGDPTERTSVQAYGQMALQATGFIVPSLYLLCFKWPFTGTGGVYGGGRVPPEVVGARWVGLAVAGLAMAAGLTCALTTRERPAATARVRVPLLTAVRLTFTDRTFLHFIGMIILTVTGVTIASAMALYVNIYHVFGGDRRAAAGVSSVSSMVVGAFSMACVPAVPMAARTLGKKGLMAVGQGLLALGGVVGWWLYTPRHPYWMVGPMLLGSAGMNCIQVLYGSFLGDICDADELRNGTRQEGMYGAAATFVNKMNYAAQGGVNGLILWAVGFSAELDVQRPPTITHMRLVFAAAPAVFGLAGMALLASFPITAARAERTRRELAERRAGRDGHGSAVDGASAPTA